MSEMERKLFGFTIQAPATSDGSVTSGESGNDHGENYQSIVQFDTNLANFEDEAVARKILRPDTLFELQEPFKRLFIEYQQISNSGLLTRENKRDYLTRIEKLQSSIPSSVENSVDLINYPTINEIKRLSKLYEQTLLDTQENISSFDPRTADVNGIIPVLELYQSISNGMAILPGPGSNIIINDQRQKVLNGIIKPAYAVIDALKRRMADLDEPKYKKWESEQTKIKIEVDQIKSAVESLMLDDKQKANLVLNDIKTLRRSLQDEIARSGSLTEGQAYLFSSVMPEHDCDFFKQFKEKFLGELIEQLNKLYTKVSEIIEPPQILVDVDASNLWTTYLRAKMPHVLSSPESNGSSEEEIKRACVELLTDYVNYATNYLWSDPLDVHTAKSESNFSKAPLRTKNQTVTYGQLFDAIPHPNLSKEFKHWLEVLVATYEGGAEWSNVIASIGSLDKFGEYLKKNLPSGSTWEAFQHMPSILTKEKKETSVGFGEQVFHSMRFYSGWNKRYVYIKDVKEGEPDPLKDELAQAIESGEIKIPTPQELISIISVFETLETKSRFSFMTAFVNIPTSEQLFHPGTSKYVASITPSDVLDQLNFVSSHKLTPQGDIDLSDLKHNYEMFVVQYKGFILERIRASKESDNQKKYGMYPLSEFGYSYKDSFLRHRQEVAISAGCMALGYGFYEPNIRQDYPNAGMLRTVDSEGKTVFRGLTPQERTAALELGKSAELVGFNLYTRSCNHMFDDDVSAKAALSYQRIGITHPYRFNYRDGRAELEGFYRRGISMIRSLFPRPLDFLSTNGRSLYKILTDPHAYHTADLSRFGDANSGQIKMLHELWLWAPDIYKAVTGGLAAISGLNIRDIGKVSSKDLIFKGIGALEFNQGAINKIATFTSKVIHYFNGHLVASKGEMDASSGGKFSGFDQQYFEELVSPLDESIKTRIHSPLFRMLWLTPAEKHILAKETSQLPEGQRSAYVAKYFTKKLLQVCIIEDLYRTNKQGVISTEDYQTMVWVFCGVVLPGATLRWDIMGSQNPFVSKTAQIFKFTPADVVYMCREAGLRPESGLKETFLAAGGLT